MVDKLLSPPGLVQFLGFTATYSDLQVTNAHYLFTMAAWNGLDLGRSLGFTQGKQFTLFAPTDKSLRALPMERTQRLLDPMWSRHLEDLLKHWITDRAFSRDQLRQLAVSSGGEVELVMLSGSTILVVADSDDGLSISDGTSQGDFFKPSSLKAVDG